MTYWDEQSWLDKIRGLLAKAEATEYEPERDAFNHKAEQLIAKYGIDRAMLYASGQLDDKVISRKIVLSDPYARQKAQLLVDIANPLRAIVILNSDESQGMQGFQVHMFGFETDVRRVELLLRSLLVQSALGMAVARPATQHKPTASKLAAFRRDWLAGFGVRVRIRLLAAEQRVARARDAATSGTTERSDGMSTELVLANRSDMVEQAINEAYPPERLRETPPHQPVDVEAFRSGIVAGATADLGAAASITQQHKEP